MLKQVWIVWPVLLSLLAVDLSRADAPQFKGQVDEQVKAGVDALVERVMNGPPEVVSLDEVDPQPRFPRGIEPEQVRLSLDWVEFAREAFFTEIPELFRGRVTRANVEYYWSQFGRHNSVVDYALVLAAPAGMLYPDDEMSGEDAEHKFPTAYRLVRHGSEVQTRSFLADRDQLERYHRLLLWSHLFYRRPHEHDTSVGGWIRRTQELFEDREDELKYWLAARNVVLLAYATGREDLLDMPTPEGVDLAMHLDEVFEIWQKWYVGNLPWLVANPETLRWELADAVQPEQEGRLPAMPLPARPADDWDEDVPLPDPWVVYTHAY